MPLEIRELVIQAKVKENSGENEEGGPVENADGNAENLKSMVEEEVYSSFSEMKKTLMKEMKIWMLEQMKKENQQF
jgi:hypothetical protein